MKKGFFIFSIVLVAIVFFNTITVKAEDKYANGIYGSGPGPSDNNSSCTTYSNNDKNNGPAVTTDGTPAPSANLPINNGVVFLLIAGVIIGITTIKKYKAVKPAMVTIS